MKALDLNKAVDGIKDILALLIGETIHLKIVLTDSLDNILADAGQMEQIILSMAINARDSMPEGGSLRISTREVMLTGEEGERHSDIPAGRYAVLEFADTGEGLSGGAWDRISKPRIATRPSGRQTGLGLSSVLDIVRRHEGFIEGDDDAGKGAAYRLYFPIADKGSDREEFPEIPLPAKGPAATILAVDDNQAIRSLIRETLAPLGYKILVAASGDEALEISRTEKEKIDLLLTDIVMPGMSGRQLINRLQSERPALKAILMSGYPADIVGPNSFLEPHLNFIEKPFMQAELVRKINQVLGESSDPSGDG